MLYISHDEYPKTGLFFRFFQASVSKCEAGRGSAKEERDIRAPWTSTTFDYWFLVLRQIKIGFWTTFSAFNKLWTDTNMNFTCIWKVFHVFCIWISCSEIQKTTEDERENNSLYIPYDFQSDITRSYLLITIGAQMLNNTTSRKCL